MRMENAFLFVLVVLGVVFAFSSPPLPSLTGFAAHQVYSSFASPEGRGVVSPVSLSFSDDAVFGTAYASVAGGAWEPFSLSGSSYPGAAGWLSGAVSASLPASLQDLGEHYVIVYSCSRSDVWDCHGTSAHPGGYWQLFVINNSAAAPSSFTLVEDGLPLADIVVAPDAPSMVVLAAEYFQRFTNDVSGALLPVREAPGDDFSFHVYVGSSDYTEALGVSCPSCRDGGYRVVSGDDYLVLLGDDDPFLLSGPQTYDEWDAVTGAQWSNEFLDYYGDYNALHDLERTDGRGSVNAVYDFFREQGMRWYHPGWFAYDRLGTIVPDKPTLSSPPLDRVVNPDFALRDFFLYGKMLGHFNNYHYDGRAEEELEYVMSLGLNSYYEYMVGSLGGPAHGLYAVVSRQKETHPEYYAVVDGVPQIDVTYPSVNLCYPYYTSENGLFNETVRFVKAMYDLYNVTIVSVTPLDGLNDIPDDCAELAVPELGLEGRYSDYVWEFVNNVAWEIYDDPAYEGRMVMSAAYAPYLLVPERLSKPLAPNIVVHLTNWRSTNADEEQKLASRAVFESWRAALAANNYLSGGVETNELFTYDYYLHNADYRGTRAAPIYFPHVIAEDLSYMKGKTLGEYIEISTIAVWPPYDYPSKQWVLDWDVYASTSLNAYVTSRLYWDADQDVDALLDEYYDLYYGPASDQMRALIEYSENNYASSVYEPVFMTTARQMATDALALVDPSSPYAHRIELLLGMMNMDYDGDEVLIDSCQTLGSATTTYRLTADVSSAGTCMLFDASGVTLDCQGHSITYSTAGGSDDNGIRIDAFNTYRGDYFNITDCVIEDGSYLSGAQTGPALYLDNADFGVVEGSFINVSGLGVYDLNTIGNEFRDNEVHSYADNAYYSQTNDAAVRKSALFSGNTFSSYGGRGFVISRGHDNSFLDNSFLSVLKQGLHITLSDNNTISGNLISSESVGALFYYQVTSPPLAEVVANNTIIDG